MIGTSLGKGGTEKSMAMLSEMLERLGCEVHTIILIDNVFTSVKGKLLNLGKNKSEHDTLMSRLRRARKIRKYLITNNFDVVIDHRPKNHYLREVIYTNYVYTGFTVVCVVHSALQALYFENQKKLTKIFKKNFINVTVSNYIEKQILNVNGILNTKTIYNAFNPQWKDNLVTLPAQLREKKYVLSYGRLDDGVKNFRFLINAFNSSQLWQEGVHLVIMGDGKDWEPLNQHANSQACADNIILLPYQENPYSVIKHSKCVALTSNFEGFPMVLLEALSLEVPVVSLDIISGPSEIIQHEKNGLLIKERNESLFANALKRMFVDDELYASCKQNALNSIQKFSQAKIEEKWQEIITTV